MDPDEALREIRVLIRQLLDSPPHRTAAVDALRLAELIEGLDDWLSGGGFPPRHWGRPGTRPLPA